MDKFSRKGLWLNPQSCPIPEKPGHIAGVFIINTITEMTLVLEKFNGKWDLPKGHLDPGEKLFEAAVRETYEETGLSPDVLTIHQYTYVTVPSKKLLRFYLGTIETDPDIQLTEHKDAYWVSKEEALQLFKKNSGFRKIVKAMYALLEG